MDKAYRIDDDKPVEGTLVFAFRTLSALKDFTVGQGPKGAMKFWEITGTKVSDDGTVDGIRIKVHSVKEVS